MEENYSMLVPLAEETEHKNNDWLIFIAIWIFVVTEILYLLIDSIIYK